MDTNITLMVVGLLVTNMTSLVQDGQRLGLVMSNTVARVEFHGKTHEFTLESVDTGTHIWHVEPQSAPYYIYLGPTKDGVLFTNVFTNNIFNEESRVYTNIYDYDLQSR